MEQKKKLAGYFFILWVAFFLNATQGNVSIYPTHGNAYQASLTQQGKIPPPSFDLKKLPVKNDWIKVRYMGGECGYDAPLFPIITTPAEYTGNFNGHNYGSFISSRSHFSFKLRGPPRLSA